MRERVREGESYPGPECREWVLPEKWKRREEERVRVSEREREKGGKEEEKVEERSGEEGWMLYIGRNVRGRLGHWLLATDHMLTIFLQKK